MIPTYSGVLSVIKKALQKLMEEYQEVGRSLQNLVEGQERNTVQLEKIRAIMEQRWSLEGEVRKEESRDNAGKSEDGSGESQEEETLSSASC